MFALVTSDTAVEHDADLQPLAEDLIKRLGVTVHVVAWDDRSFDWTSVDAAVIRSTWDYTDRLDEFLTWVDQVAAVTQLINSARIVHWNADKRYLTDLSADGIGIAQTVFVSPGAPIPQLTDIFEDTVFVVKPTVGAGSSGARRCRLGEVAEHVHALHTYSRTAMIQPYLGGLDEHGETALCFVSASNDSLEFSHAFRKGAILKTTDVEQVGGIFAKEAITGRDPTPAEFHFAQSVLLSDAVRSKRAPLFARVDVAPVEIGGRDHIESLVVMELELIEPSFYFATSPGSAGRFGSALVDAVRGNR